MRVILATSNKNKIKEFREILKDIEIYSMLDFGYNVDPEETASDFKGNAYIKAKALYDSMKDIRKEDDIILSDDSGFMIDYLNGEPGIKSARYLGDKTYEERFKYILNMMKDVKGKDRSCTFVCTLCMIHKDKVEYFEGKVDGEVSTKISGTEGFGYDPIFYIPSLKKTVAELTGKEKNDMSHRRIALDKFMAYITKKAKIL